MGNRFIQGLKYIKNCVLEVLYPPHDGCLICDSLSDELLCKNCREKISFCKDAFVIKKEDNQVFCYSMSYYSSIIKELVLRLKFKGDFDCGTALSKLLFEYVKVNKISADIITFVPSSKSTLIKRGYNQSLILAKYLGELMEVKVLDTLTKGNCVKDQIGLNTVMRWQNLSGSYSLKANIDLKSKKVLLIDDVVTTGATVYFCYNELKKGLPKSITVLTVAKSKL